MVHSCLVERYNDTKKAITERDAILQHAIVHQVVNIQGS